MKDAIEDYSSALFLLSKLDKISDLKFSITQERGKCFRKILKFNQSMIDLINCTENIKMSDKKKIASAFNELGTHNKV